MDTLTETEEETSASRKSFYNDVVNNGLTEKFVPIKTKTMEIKVCRISPAQARYILQRCNNTDKLQNRKASKVLVKKYANDMTNGSWKSTGETIQFSSDGQLMDGQHRLLAVIMSDLPQTFLIVFGINKESFDVIDSGKTRSFGDIAAIKGYSDPIMLTALARAVIMHNLTGDVDSGQSKYRGGGAYEITKTQVMNYLKHNPDLGSYLPRYRKASIVSSVTAAFCYWLLAKDDKEHAESYLDSIFFGYNMKEDTIEAYLHHKLQRNAKAIQKKMTKKAVIANIIEGYRRVRGYSKNKAKQITWDTRNDLPQIK